MREIKFRGKSKRNNQWMYGDLIRKFGNGGIYYTIETLSGDFGTVKTDSVGEYIGLKDKNNNEIYEGDIVKAESWNPQVFEIRFIEGGFCAYNEVVKGYPTDINLFYSSVGCSIEVIGNIYENPELLNI